MKSSLMLEEVAFQNSPLFNLLLKLSFAFKVLYILPPKPNKIGPPGKKAQQTGESYEAELKDFNEELRFLNSDKDSNWMEGYFEEAIRSPGDEWGSTGYISNEIRFPSNDSKRKLRSSNTRYNQGGTFSDPSAEADEGQDATMDESKDYEDYDEGDGENDEGNGEPPSSRRRLN